jgi:cobalt-zinc-cadmium efflux system membrane fusion protein
MSLNLPSPAGFSRPQQLAILAGLLGAALGVAGIVSVLTVGRPRPAAAGAAPAQGVFRPTADQWRALTVATVQTRTFDAIETTEGRIETDGDRTTPVVSPFTGRVVQVFAEPGQRLAKGAPLFAVAANEVAQGRSDLSVALGAAP